MSTKVDSVKSSRNNGKPIVMGSLVKLPETTEKEPYIEFRFNKKGKLSLKPSSSWWGGKNSGFVSSDGSEGNTCLPKDLDKYIKAFKERKVKSIEKEIQILTNRLQKVKNQ